MVKQNYFLGATILQEKFIRQNRRFVLHGAGLHTRQLFSILGKKLFDNLIGILDSHRMGESFENFTVLHPKEISSLQADYFILSSDANQSILKQELLEYGVPEDKIIDLYGSDDLEHYLFAIDETITNAIADEIHQIQNPLIVISNSMGINHLKLLKYLKDDYDLFILTSNQRVQSLDISCFRDQFTIKLLDSPAQIIDTVTRLNRGMVLTISGMYYNSLGAAVTSVSNIPCYALFLDILSSAFDDISTLEPYCDASNELLAEELLWRFSQGVVFKEDISLARKNIENFQPKKYLKYLDYCDGRIQIQTKKSTQFDQLKFVYAGGLALENDPNFSIHASILEIAKYLNAQGHCLELYDAYYSESKHKNPYQRYSHEKYAYHPPVSVFELPHVLSRYDIGLSLFSFESTGVEKNAYYVKGGFSKIMAYIEAEIPVVISKETEYMADLIRDYDIGTAISFSELDTLMERLTPDHYARWKQNIIKAKKELSYDAHINELLEFMKESQPPC